MKFCDGFLICLTVSQMKKILEQDTYIAVKVYKGQIINYNSVDVWIFHVYAIFLMLSCKMLVQ